MNMNGKKILNSRSSLFKFKMKFIIWHLWPYFEEKLPLINKDIFEPHKSSDQRGESS